MFLIWCQRTRVYNGAVNTNKPEACSHAKWRAPADIATRHVLIHALPALAIYFQHTNMVRALGKGGADVNLGRESDGCTPLMIACELNHADLVGVLVRDLKADVHATDSKGNVARQCTDDEKVMKMLV